MVTLDGENAGGGFEQTLVGQQGGSALVSRNAHVFEDECAKQEADFIGEGIERCGKTGGGGGGVECVGEVDRRSRR